jgi:hypothetical protein
MHDAAKFQEHLGKEENYPNYLAFFQHEIDAKGFGGVLAEYLFAGDERAENMMCRLFAGKYLSVILLFYVPRANPTRPRPPTHPPRFRY